MDLLEASDYKALMHILTCADRMQGCIAESGPFCTPFVDLAGPHIDKFTGDSDAILGLRHGLRRICSQTFPAFVLDLSDLSATLAQDSTLL